MPAVLLIEDRSYGLAERLNLAEHGKKFVCSFIEPGIVDYRDSGGGVELLTKAAIDDGLQTFIGNPLTIGHVPRKRLNERGVAQGFVQSARWNPDTGWYDCEGSVSTDEARREIRNGKLPSCGYTVLEYGPGGIYHNIPYEAEIKKIRFHHLALVDNPRYESADIRLNSKGKSAMFNIIKKILGAAAGAPSESTATLPADQQVEIDGKAVRLNDIAAAWRAKQAKETADAAAAAKDKELAAEKVNKIEGDDEVEIDGKRVKMNELVTCYRQYGQKENEKGGNADESEEAKKTRENAAAAEQKAKDDAAAKEKENAIAAQKKKDEEAAAAAKEKENAAGRASFNLLEQARTLPPAPSNIAASSSNSMAEGVARGASRYGSHGKN